MQQPALESPTYMGKHNEVSRSALTGRGSRRQACKVVGDFVSSGSVYPRIVVLRVAVRVVH